MNLPHVTLICVDTVNYGKAIYAIQQSLKQITPAKTIFFTDIPYRSDQFQTVVIPTLHSAKEYSEWMIKSLGKQEEIETPMILIIQHDGYVLDGSRWSDDWLRYDYIGAPWLERDGMNVGNGGFSLRTTRLHYLLAADKTILALHPEDSAICRIYRDYLEKTYSIRFAPDLEAEKFAYELREPVCSTFGFHGEFHQPFKPTVVLRRLGALGDVVAMEPVISWYHDNGYNVVLDSPCIEVFMMHRSGVRHFSVFDKSIPHKVIDLDMAYEVNPRQLHLKSYFEVCGITDYTLRNPQLTYNITSTNKMFRKYCVIHIDLRDTPHRNVYGIHWRKVREHLEILGYTVIQVGHGTHPDVGHWINTVNIPLLMWLIAGADLFIGVDSGPANIAMALGRKCILFFGSVNPSYIYPDPSKAIIMQSPCPFGRQNCWHEDSSTTGSTCDKPEEPPCCVNETSTLISHITELS